MNSRLEELRQLKEKHDKACFSIGGEFMKRWEELPESKELQLLEKENKMSNEKDESNARNQAEAQLSSIIAMVAALEVDYDRLEELRDKKKDGHFVAGWNMPGFMPDSEPVCFDDVDDAREYIADEMLRYAEELEIEADETDAYKNLISELKITANHLKEFAASDNEGYGATFGKWHFWITHKPNELGDKDEAEELEELEGNANGNENEDEAREAIYDDPLEIQVRSDWHSPGDEDNTPTEFYILLCTGGPAVRIMGELDRCEPCRAWIEYQDWFLPWTEYIPSREEYPGWHDSLLAYCRAQHFGEY